MTIEQAAKLLVNLQSQLKLTQDERNAVLAAIKTLEDKANEVKA